MPYNGYKWVWYAREVDGVDRQRGFVVLEGVGVARTLIYR